MFNPLDPLVKKMVELLDSTSNEDIIISQFRILIDDITEIEAIYKKHGIHTRANPLDQSYYNNQGIQVNLLTSAAKKGFNKILVMLFDASENFNLNKMREEPFKSYNKTQPAHQQETIELKAANPGKPSSVGIYSVDSTPVTKKISKTQVIITNLLRMG